MAIFGVQQWQQRVINYFCANGSTVYVASLDASKAFDHVNHDISIRKLHERNLPLCYCMTNLPQW